MLLFKKKHDKTICLYLICFLSVLILQVCNNKLVSLISGCYKKEEPWWVLEDLGYLHGYCSSILDGKNLFLINWNKNDNTNTIIHIFQDDYLSSVLSEIFEKLCNEVVNDDKPASLQSSILKLVTHFDDMKYVFDLVSFLYLS